MENLSLADLMIAEKAIEKWLGEVDKEISNHPPGSEERCKAISQAYQLLNTLDKFKAAQQ